MPSLPHQAPGDTFAAGLPRALGEKYTLVQEVGRGGMATVHLALAGGIGARRVCAVKTIAYRPGERDADMLSQRFLEEAAAVTRLNHDNLVYVFDAGVVERQLFLAMEFIEGKTLADLMALSRKQQKQLPLDLSIFLATEVLQGLSQVHQNRLVHRDVSPSNVMVSATGGVKLLDFGLARSVESSRQTGLAMKLGKVGYAAPEQLLGGPVDPRADVFSVGVMLWEMLSGRSLFAADSTRPRSLPFESPSLFNPNAPKELDETLRMALADAPEDRFFSVSEFGDELSRYLIPDDHKKNLRRYLEAQFGAQLAHEKAAREAAIAAASTISQSKVPPSKELGPMVSPEGYIGVVLDNRYKLLRLMGRGSMGAVYEAEHVGIGRKVAIKIPFLHGSPELKARFVREARATNKINDQHVVDITDAGETPQGDAFVVMDYLEGRDLEQWNEEKKVWPYDDALDVAAQIARGLEAAHEAGVIHRDLKPSNIMLVETRQGPLVKVLDFGVAKLMHSEAELPIDGLTRPDTALGTPRYMAPEQMLEGQAVGKRADIYAAAVILYEMLSGKLPHSGNDTAALCWAKLNTPAQPLDAENLQLPPKLAGLVMEALALDPEQRPSSASTWRSRLEACRPERRRGSGTAPVALRTPPSPLRFVPVALLGFAFIGAMISWWYLQPSPDPGPAAPTVSSNADPAPIAPTPVPVVDNVVSPPSETTPQPLPAPTRAPAAATSRTPRAPTVQAPAASTPAVDDAELTKLLDATERALVKGDFAGANRFALEALSIGKSARAYAMLARVHMAQGEKKAALAVVEEGMRRHPDDSALAKLAERLK